MSFNPCPHGCSHWGSCPHCLGLNTLPSREPLNLPAPRPQIVCLCGSTRYGNFFRAANLRLTLEGEIVLSVGCDTKDDADLAAAGVLGHDIGQSKAALDELHKRKIDLADYVHVVSDESGYFGNSTLSEIEYALAHGKPVTYANEAAAKRARDHGLLTEAPVDLGYLSLPAEVQEEIERGGDGDRS